MTHFKLEILCDSYSFQVLIIVAKMKLHCFQTLILTKNEILASQKIVKKFWFCLFKNAKNQSFGNFEWMEFTKAQFYAFHNLNNEILHNFEKRHCLDLGHCKLLPVQWRKIVSLLQTQWNFCLAHKLKTRLYLMAQPIFFCFQLLLYGHCRSSRLTELNSKPYPPKILVAGKMVAPDLFYGTRNGRRKIGRRANGDLCTFSNVYIGLY